MRYIHTRFNGKSYVVTVSESGNVYINAQWDAIVPSTRFNALPQFVTASRPVSPGGTLGRKLLFSLAKEGYSIPQMYLV